MKPLSWLRSVILRLKDKLKELFIDTSFESLLLSSKLISNSFQEISRGNVSRKNRIIHLIINVYLILETIKLSYWIILPVEDEWSLLTGSFFACLGKTGKVIYIAIIAAVISTIICRFTFYFREKSGDLDFLLDPIDFKGLDPQSCHVKKLKNELDKIKVVNFKRLFLVFLGYSFVTFTTILSLQKYGTQFIVNFLIGWISHACHSWFHMNSSVVIGCLWKIALTHLQTRLFIIRDKIIENQTSISIILQELDSFHIQVIRFDKCLRWFLFASFLSFTPLFCNLLNTAFYGEFNEGGVWLKLIIFLMLPVFMVENVLPMFEMSKVWFLSRDLYRLLQKVVIDSGNAMSIQDRMKVLKWMKAVTDDDHPLAPMTITAEPLTPNGFFHYVMGIIMNFLMLTDMLYK